MTRKKDSSTDDMRVRVFRGQSRGKVERYVSAYTSGNGSELPFAGKAMVDIESQKEIVLNQKYPRSETDLQSLPIWKRDKVREIYLARQEIYMKADELAGPIRNLSPYERRQWVADWNKKNQPELKRLKQLERQVLNQSLPEPPSEEDVSGFLQKLSDEEPVFQEADLVVIEYLLPTRKEMERSRAWQQPQMKQLLDAHYILSKHFPQSVNRNEILSLSRKRF